ARVGERRRGNGCPVCAKKIRGETFRRSVLKRSGSLVEKYPELAEEWHPTRNGDLTPYQITPGSNKKVWWRCSREHEWEATLSLEKLKPLQSKLNGIS
ncbi:MAG: zinc-ribbon domain-containing protein, partial [Candidatus Bathyarchaeota archaeon]|nr:zinc-ribbon domain-containing protein [Candidatus Bathyarchaeota archaeon]